MALTRSLKVYNGSDAVPVTDVTDRTDWPGTELSGLANLGEASASEWLMRDEGGTIPDFLGAGELLDSHNVIVATVGSNTLFRGRIAADDHFRGRQQAGRAKEITFTLEDANSHLRGIAVHDWVRPAETDAARAQALVAAYLSGSPRPTTNLNGSNLIVTGSNAITLPAKTYSGVTPYEIMQELASNADKEMFVSVDNELAYFGHDYTGYASLLRISDAGYPGGADESPTTWVPWDPHGSEFGRQKLSALRTYYGSDVTQSTIQLTNSQAPRFDYWEDIFWDSESVTAAQAEARAQKMLDYRSTDDVNYTCSIGPLSGDEIWKIKPGQSISFKSRAARGGRNANGSYSGDTFLTTRLRQITWTMPNEDQYLARLELERPKRTQPPSRGNQALATMPEPAPIGSTPSGSAPGSCIETFTRNETSTWGISELGPPFLALSSPTNFNVDGNYGTITGAGSGGARNYMDALLLSYPLDIVIHMKPMNAETGLVQFLGSVQSQTGLFQAPLNGPFQGFDFEFGPEGLINNWRYFYHATAIATPISTDPVVEFGGAFGLYVRLFSSDTYFRVRAWPEGDPEPSAWNVADLTVTGGVAPAPTFLWFSCLDASDPRGIIGFDFVEFLSGLDCGLGDSLYYARFDDPRFDDPFVSQTKWGAD